jgi:hypothetical protein
MMKEIKAISLMPTARFSGCAAAPSAATGF